MRLNTVINTSGRGIHTDVAKGVRVIRLELLANADKTGELRARFDSRSWKVVRDGYIHSDPMFLRELRQAVKEQGLPANSVDYDESLPQGDDYVALAVTKRFVNAWERAQAEPAEG